MISIGNDIVSLKSARSERFTQKEYYAKILSPSEELLYNDRNFLNVSFKDFIWLLWTVKESVYKFCKRNDAGLLFNPTKIVTENMELTENRFRNFSLKEIKLNDFFCVRGSVALNNSSVFFTSLVTEDFIFTVANKSNNFNNIFSGIKHIDNTDYATQSQTVRNFVTETLQDIYPQAFLQIEKNAIGYPVLFKDRIETDTLLSFSHHDFLVAYSFILPQ